MRSRADASGDFGKMLVHRRDPGLRWGRPIDYRMTMAAPVLREMPVDRAWLGASLAVRGAMASRELSVEPQVSEIPRLLEWVTEACGAEGLGEDIRFKLMLALEEAVTNAIDHAFDGVPPPHRISVRLDVGAGSIAAEVVDNGREFDPTAAPEPDLTLTLEERTPGGLGIHLMRRVMDRLEYTRRGAENVLRMEKARP